MHKLRWCLELILLWLSPLITSRIKCGTKLNELQLYWAAPFLRPTVTTSKCSTFILFVGLLRIGRVVYAIRQARHKNLDMLRQKYTDPTVDLLVASSLLLSFIYR